MVRSRNLKTIYHKKMKPKWEGPFLITEVPGLVTYRLQLPATWRIHNVFHAALLQSYKENEVYGGNFVKTPPELENGEEFYEVETILNQDEVTNILSNGGDIQSPMPHGNPNMCFQMTVTHWHATKFDTTFDMFYLMLPTPCLPLTPLTNNSTWTGK